MQIYANIKDFPCIRKIITDKDAISIFHLLSVSQHPPVNLQPGPADNLVVEMLLHPFPAVGSVTAGGHNCFIFLSSD